MRDRPLRTPPAAPPAAEGAGPAEPAAKPAEAATAPGDPLPSLSESGPTPAATPEPAGSAEPGAKADPAAAVPPVEPGPAPADPASPAPAEPAATPPSDAAAATPTPPVDAAAKPADAATTGADAPAQGGLADAAEASTTPRRRVTWGELAASANPKLAAAEPRRSLIGRLGRSPAKAKGKSEPDVPAAADGEPAACQFDGRRQQLLDFRLPDLQGRTVRFQDLGADLVLLDFWGTWCGPCLQSVPHLIDLQQRLGGRNFKVVGIAYEKAGSTAERVAAVGESARKLGINYQVLLGDMETCPLQAAFHVQAYPTMILLDRQGRVLWRDQGSSAGTLARLDRVIDAQARAAVARR